MAGTAGSARALGPADQDRRVIRPGGDGGPSPVQASQGRISGKHGACRLNRFVPLNNVREDHSPGLKRFTNRGQWHLPGHKGGNNIETDRIKTWQPDPVSRIHGCIGHTQTNSLAWTVRCKRSDIQPTGRKESSSRLGWRTLKLCRAASSGMRRLAHFSRKSTACVRFTRWHGPAGAQPRIHRDGSGVHILLTAGRKYLYNLDSTIFNHNFPHDHDHGFPPP